MRTPVAALSFIVVLSLGAPVASAGSIRDVRQNELQGVMFATSPAEEWQSVWTDHSRASQIQKPKGMPVRSDGLQSGCEALGSVVTELGSISGRCVT